MSLDFPLKNPYKFLAMAKTAFICIIERSFKGSNEGFDSYKTRLRYGNQKYLSGTIYLKSFV